MKLFDLVAPLVLIKRKIWFFLNSFSKGRVMKIQLCTETFTLNWIKNGQRIERSTNLQLLTKKISIMLCTKFIIVHCTLLCSGIINKVKVGEHHFLDQLFFHSVDERSASDV